MISTNEMKRGMCVEIDGDIYRVLSFEHIKMGRGSAQVKMKVQNVRSGAIVERGYQSGAKFPRITLEYRKVQYSYHDEDLYTFMDTQTYDQLQINRSQLGDDAYYLKDGVQVDLLMYGDEPVGVELPTNVDLLVTETEPGYKGDTATGGNKPAIMETGLKILVPLFVGTGDTIKVDTRSGQYLERVS